MTEQVQNALSFPSYAELKTSIKKFSKELIPGVSQPKIYQVTAGQRINSSNFWIYEGNTKLNYNCILRGPKTYKTTFVLNCTHKSCKGAYLAQVCDSSMISSFITYCEGKRPRKKIKYRLNINHKSYQNIEMYQIVKIITSHSCPPKSKIACVKNIFRINNTINSLSHCKNLTKLTFSSSQIPRLFSQQSLVGVIDIMSEYESCKKKLTYRNQTLLDKVPDSFKYILMQKSSYSLDDSDISAPFLQLESTNLIIFFLFENLQMLDIGYRRINGMPAERPLGGDATFHICRNTSYSQCFSIVYYQSDPDDITKSIAVPIASCFMRKKTEAIYVQFLTFLKEKFIEKFEYVPRVPEIISDMEPAIGNSFRSVFQSNVRYCLFHVKDALLKRLKSVIHTDFKNSVSACQIKKVLLGFPYLPKSLLPKAFTYLQNLILGFDEPDAAKFLPFLKYLQVFVVHLNFA